jgi:hypothetical protein
MLSKGQSKMWRDFALNLQQSSMDVIWLSFPPFSTSRQQNVQTAAGCESKTKEFRP